MRFLRWIGDFVDGIAEAVTTVDMEVDEIGGHDLSFHAILGLS